MYYCFVSTLKIFCMFSVVMGPKCAVCKLWKWVKVFFLPLFDALKPVNMINGKCYPHCVRHCLSCACLALHAVIVLPAAVCRNFYVVCWLLCAIKIKIHGTGCVAYRNHCKHTKHVLHLVGMFMKE